MGATRSEVASRNDTADIATESADAGRAHGTAIVVGLDGRRHDADAIALAHGLRMPFGGEIVLVHVVPDAPLLGRGMGELQSLELHEGRELLARAAAASAVTVATELLRSWPAALALERVAFRRHASLVVLGSSHRATLGGVVPSTVALRLLKGAPCPVAVAPAGYAEAPIDPITAIGLAYDASGGSEQALHVAGATAARLKVPLHIYHAVPGDELDELARAQMLSFGKVILDRAREQLPPYVTPRTRELLGDPAAAILRATREDRISLLFAGSRGHGPLREGLFGGVCAALLRSAPCPLVLTR